ncbi:MAG: hypothetical protein R2742_13730 [Micropruina glycogenica]
MNLTNTVSLVGTTVGAGRAPESQARVVVALAGALLAVKLFVDYHR